MATPSPIVSMAPTKVTTTNAGRSAQNSGPGVRSSPGHEPNGTPTQGASSTCWALYSPKNAATEQPAIMPMSGDHIRNPGGARRTSAAVTARVARAVAGAAADDASSGTSISISNTRGITVAAISMITVPATVGVNMRRSSESRAASAN